MTTMELKAIRMQADLMISTPADRYQIRDEKGIIVAFDLSLDRANDWAKYYRNAKVERMTI